MATVNDLPNSFERAAKFLGGKSGKTCGYATKVTAETEQIGTHSIDVYCIYHFRTKIITFYPDDSVKITTQGWRSRTTRKRINLALRRWKISCCKGLWYLYDWTCANPEGYPFYEGDRVFTVAHPLIDRKAIYEDIQETGYNFLVAMKLAAM